MPVFTPSVGTHTGTAVVTISRPRLPMISISIGLPRLPSGNIRRRGRERWQARVYVGGRKGGAVSLGFYGSETAAAQVIRKVLRKLLGSALAKAELEEPNGKLSTATIGPLEVWRAARRLADDGWDVDGQLACLPPRCVCPDGRGGYGIRVRGGNGCDRGGFETPEAAFQAASRARARMKLLAERAESEAEERGVAVA